MNLGHDMGSSYEREQTQKSRISVVLPVLAPTPFLRAMTEFAIKALRTHADAPFELIIAESETDWFNPKKHPIAARTKTDKPFLMDVSPGVDLYLPFPKKLGGIRETNAAIEAASGEFVLCAGNDVIPPPGWDTELLSIFGARKDCGVAALAAFEPGAVIGPREQAASLPPFVEGMYSPFMMFRRHFWRFDEGFHKIYQDSDLILRMYESGLRAYRSCRKHVHHLLRMTSDRVDPAGHAADLAHDERLFYRRWGGSPLWMFGVIRSGYLQYGSEHEAWTRPINLHHDPKDAAADVAAQVASGG